MFDAEAWESAFRAGLVTGNIMCTCLAPGYPCLCNNMSGRGNWGVFAEARDVNVSFLGVNSKFKTDLKSYSELKWFRSGFIF